MNGVAQALVIVKKNPHQDFPGGLNGIDLPSPTIMEFHSANVRITRIEGDLTTTYNSQNIGEAPHGRS